MRRTKIVATIGPATSDPETMRGIVAAGADIVRLNAAHGDRRTHAAAAALAREVSREAGRAVGVLVDLPGPKLRTGEVAGGRADLVVGTRFTLRCRRVEGDATQVSTTVPDLARWVRPGDPVFLADGEIALTVVEIAGDDVVTEVVRGGELLPRKGMHVPRAEHDIEPFTEADAAALELAIAIRAEFVGLSFVRHADDVTRIQGLLPRRGARPALVAKIETAAAVDHLPGIVAATDALIVARGDLGIQVPARRVPLLQKEIIRFGNIAGKPVITATQMLESMTRSVQPTRAEVNDVANAVIDGTDALMLSEETAIGLHPVEAVRTMAEVAESAEGWPRHHTEPTGVAADDDRVAWAVAHAAVQAAEDLRVAAILCPTRSGTTAQRVAAFRPSMPIAGISPLPEVLGRLALAWGVQPLAVPLSASAGDQLRLALDAARGRGLVRDGDLVAVVSASPGPRAGSTDTVRIVRA